MLPRSRQHPKLSMQQLAFEELELRLRLHGVPREALDGDVLDGLVELRDDRWVLTRTGRLMANEISTRLIVPSTVAGDY